MTIGSRRWSIALVSVIGLLGLGAACIYRGYNQNLPELVIGIVGVVAGYCGFDMGVKVARAKAGSNPETGDLP